MFVKHFSLLRDLSEPLTCSFFTESLVGEGGGTWCSFGGWPLTAGTINALLWSLTLRASTRSRFERSVYRTPFKKCHSRNLFLAPPFLVWTILWRYLSLSCPQLPVKVSFGPSFCLGNEMLWVILRACELMLISWFASWLQNHPKSILAGGSVNLGEEGGWFCLGRKVNPPPAASAVGWGGRVGGWQGGREG